jgi:hypothetical protein
MDMQEFSKYGHVSGLLSFEKAGLLAQWRYSSLARRPLPKATSPFPTSPISSFTKDSGGRICRLTDRDGRRHAFSERHWFGWEAGERRRFGASELHSATFTSLVSAIRRRIGKPA